jgi:hypothetical protein
MIQDQAFLPYGQPTLAASVTQPLPRLPGRLDRHHAAQRPDRLAAGAAGPGAGYRYDDRDNKTPRDEYVYIGGDSQTQDTGATSSRRRFNEPYSYQEHQLKLDAGYQLFRRTDLTVGAERKETERTYSEREEATEDTYRVGLKATSRRRSARESACRAPAATARRIGGEEPFRPTRRGIRRPFPWENHPDAEILSSDRRRDTVAWFAALTPGENWAVGVNATYLRDDYERSEMGLTDGTMGNYTVDMSYHLPSAAVTTYAFYTYEHLRSDQDGPYGQFSGARSNSRRPPIPRLIRHASRPDGHHRRRRGEDAHQEHAGPRRGLRVRQVERRSRRDRRFLADHGPAPGVHHAAQLPQPVRQVHDAAGHGPEGAYWEKFRSTDWAVDNVDPNTLANVITLGEDSPDYTVHVLTMSFVYRF